MNRRLKLLHYTKRMVFLSLLGSALMMTGLTSVLSYAQHQQHTTDMTLSEHTHTELVAELSEWLGEVVEEVTVVERANGVISADIDTIFGYQRIIFDQTDEGFVVTDAFRL